MINKYPNTLKQITMTHEDIEKQIVEYPLNFLGVKDGFVEWRLSPPMFLFSFYDFIINHQCVPTQAEYWDHYVHRAKEWITTHNLDMSQLNGLKARALRAYPSFVRDIHFAKLLESTGQYSLVYYNENLDIHDGIDIVVTKGGKSYCVRLFVNTRRSQMGKEKKAKRHKENDGYKYIDLPISFQNRKQCGQFFLCSNDDVIRLNKAIIMDERSI